MIAVHLECTSAQVITNAQVIVTLLHSTKEKHSILACCLAWVLQNFSIWQPCTFSVRSVQFSININSLNLLKRTYFYNLPLLLVYNPSENYKNYVNNLHWLLPAAVHNFVHQDLSVGESLAARTRKQKIISMKLTLLLGKFKFLYLFSKVNLIFTGNLPFSYLGTFNCILQISIIIIICLKGK